jgi:putative ABC transport system permease protein
MQWHDLVSGDKKIYVAGGAAHPDFLKIIQYPFLKGNPATALNDPNSIVLSEKTAKMLFGNEDAMNKVVRFDNQASLKVTGVVKDMPQNATISYSFLTPFSFKEQTEGWLKGARTNWGNNSFNTYVKLMPGANYDQVSAKIRNIVYQKGAIMRPAKPFLVLHAAKNWHLYATFIKGVATGGFIDYVRLFSIIGVLVLVIASINFMNLSTARSEKRAREVGVRKAVGSQRSDLIWQFLSESVLITFIASLFSILIVQLALPSLNHLTGGSLSIPYANPLFWGAMMAFVLFTGLVAGCRPAFYLSSFNPVKVLKGAIQVGKAAALPRKVLVVVQFTCSVALIISTIIVYRQIQYAKNRPTGYSRDRLVMSDMSADLNKHYAALKNDLLSCGAVESVTLASAPVTNVYSHTSLMSWPGKTAGDEQVNIATFWVSDNYFKTVGMKLLQGRDFSGQLSDTLSVVLNEAAVKRTGLKDPIGQVITWNGSNVPVRVIGVVRDALMKNPYEKVEPALFNMGLNMGTVMFRLKPSLGTHDAITRVGRIFDRYNPAYPFSPNFADTEYNAKFQLEELVGKMASILAGLAVFISCLGLFGLAAYVAEQRTKEIGIRKVLGASISGLWLLLSGEFVMLVIISCIVATPIAFYFLNNWLQKFYYHTPISMWVFVIAGVIAVLITLATISFQAIKAAMINPVKSLRSE